MSAFLDLDYDVFRWLEKAEARKAEGIYIKQLMFRPPHERQQHCFVNMQQGVNMPRDNLM